MIVEHTFVTTLERDDALLLADGLFGEMGFGPPPGARGPGEWAAGKDGGQRLTRVRRMVRMEFDRGRVMLAASAVTSNKIQEEFYKTYLLALASAAESHVSRGVPAEVAAKPVRAVMEAMAKKERRAWVILSVVLGVLVVLFAVMILVAVLGP